MRPTHSILSTGALLIGIPEPLGATLVPFSHLANLSSPFPPRSFFVAHSEAGTRGLGRAVTVYRCPAVTMGRTLFYTIFALDAKEDFLFPGLPTALPTVVAWTRSILPEAGQHLQL